MTAASVPRGNANLIPTAQYNTNGAQWLIEHYRNGSLKLDELVTVRRPLDEVNDAFDDMAAGRVARTVLIP